MPNLSDVPPPDSVAVRQYLVDALRLDLIGPRPQDQALQNERLPQAPSRWYLTGFLVPTNAPDEQRAQDPEEEFDEPTEPIHGSDDSTTPDRGSGKRNFLPSSMGLSMLVDDATARLDVALSWGDYSPESRGGGETPRGQGEPSPVPGNGKGEDGDSSRRRFLPWIRHPRAELVTIDLSSVQTGVPTPFKVPDSGGLEVVCLVRPTRVQQFDRVVNAHAVSVFIINRRLPPKQNNLQDTAFAFQVEMSVEADRPLVPRPNPHGFDSEDWDERLADLHYRDVTEYAVGHNVSTSIEIADGACRRVRTEWMPQAGVERVEPSAIADVEFGMEVLASLADASTAKQLLDPLVTQYRDWIDKQHAVAQALSGRRKEVAEELVKRAIQVADRIQGGIDLLSDPDVLEAFRIANRAMASAARRRQAQAEKSTPQDVSPPVWRPFQLAYILLNLRGIVEPTHVEREIVDLLFFPTGGGKTESLSRSVCFYPCASSATEP